MEFKFDVKEILTPINLLTSVTNTKNVVAMLDNIKFEVIKTDRLRLTTSDSETWLQMDVPITDGHTGVGFCINADSVAKAIRNLTEGQVTVETDRQRFMVTFDYGRGHFTMPFLESSDYPTPLECEKTDIRSVTTDGQILSTAIDDVIHSCGNDTIRPILNGIYFVISDGKMTTVATDKEKLSRRVQTLVECDSDTDFVLPRKPASVLRSVLGYKTDVTVTLTTDSRQIVFASEDFVLTTILQDGRYPKYESIIPRSAFLSATVERERLLSAVKRITPMGDAVSEIMSFRLSQGMITVRADDSDFYKSGEEDVPCKCDGNDVVGFKGTPLIQVLQKLHSDSVHVEMTDNCHPVVFYDDDKDKYLSLLMPRMLHEQ